MARQRVRISQMVTTWGPGAVLESGRGPRVVLRDGLILPPGYSLQDLELIAPVLQVVLSGRTGNPASHIGVFRVPSRDFAGGARWVTRPFPEWKLCVPHGVLYRQRCPRCGRGRPEEAIRFVLACPRGHLDDVDWDLLVHGRQPPHRPDHYQWQGGGAGLSEIRIRCPQPRCSGHASLGDAWGRTWPCTGRFPEREGPAGPPSRPGCAAGARIIQRQASNLRVPEVITVFTVPPIYTRLHELLQAVRLDLSIYAASGLLFGDRGELRREMLGKLLDRARGECRIGERDASEILTHGDDELARAIRDVIGYRPPEDIDGVLREEFRAFLRGADEGIPPLQTGRPASKVLLEINPNRIRRCGPFRVVPVERIRLITVQLGYRRFIDVPGAGGQQGLPDLVDISITGSGSRRWYPAFEGAGEALFIADEPGRPPSGPAASAWERARTTGICDRLLSRGGRQELAPAFVWWHTLSHLLIRALALDSGYEAASLRERVYLEESPSGVRGGILIYAASRGGDGTMGGLLALVPVFDRFLERALDMARVCSGDPLCRDHRFQAGEVLGAACHGCCLVSETSCEHRNFWLDRNVLLENPP